MTQKLTNSIIYFKVFLPYKTLNNEETFISTCKNLKNYPLKDEYSSVSGLFLRGERFTQKAHFSDIPKIDKDSIKKIDSIIPIIKAGDMPYLLEEDYFDARIPAGEKDIEQVISSINAVNRFVDRVFIENNGKYIESHWRCGRETEFYRYLFLEVFPQCFNSDYSYIYYKGNETLKGSLHITENNTDLPDDIIDFASSFSTGDSIKLFRDEHAITIEAVNQLEMAISLYSNEPDWFLEVLQAFADKNLFDSPDENNTYSIFPFLNLYYSITQIRR